MRTFRQGRRMTSRLLFCAARYLRTQNDAEAQVIRIVGCRFHQLLEKLAPQAGFQTAVLRFRDRMLMCL